LRFAEPANGQPRFADSAREQGKVVVAGNNAEAVDGIVLQHIHQVDQRG
jgi:hypothetical protein